MSDKDLMIRALYLLQEEAQNTLKNAGRKQHSIDASIGYYKATAYLERVNSLLEKTIKS